jgi:hypothetical protein
VLVALLAVATMPDLAGGLLGRLQARHYPADWAAARAVLDRSDDRARVIVLPWSAFRRFPWTGPDPVLDPAPRLLPRQAVVSDALRVGDARVPEEGEGARAAAAALRDGELSDAELRALDVGWVLVERTTPGEPPRLPADWRPAYAGPELELLRAPDPLPGGARAATARVVGRRRRAPAGGGAAAGRRHARGTAGNSPVSIGSSRFARRREAALVS